MKHRGGFVSNSSSASFVLIGFDVDPRAEDANIAKLREFFGLPPAVDDSDGLWDDDLHDAMDRASIRYITHTERGAPSDDRHLMGVVVSEVHSEGGGWSKGPTETSIEDLLEMVRPLAQAMGVSKSSVKLHTGTRNA